jgi:hypothetical protein
MSGGKIVPLIRADARADAPAAQRPLADLTDDELMLLVADATTPQGDGVIRALDLTTREQWASAAC